MTSLWYSNTHAVRSNEHLNECFILIPKDRAACEMLLILFLFSLSMSYTLPMEALKLLCILLQTKENIQEWCWCRTQKCSRDVGNAPLAFLLGLASGGRLPSVVEVLLLWNCYPQKVGLKNISTLLSSFFWLQSLNIIEAKVSELNVYAKDTQHRWIIYVYK